MSGTFEYKNTKISYSDEGSGQVLLFIHGFLEDKRMWNPFIENFKSTYRCISVDLFGHGNSENYGYIHTMEEQAAMIKSLLDKLRLRRYTVIGHSMGGYIALELAKKYPKHLRGLVLQNSTSHPDTKEKIANRNRAIRAVKDNPTLFIQVAIPMLFSEKSRTLFKKEIAEVTSTALKTSEQGIIAALEGMKIRKNHAELLKKSAFPILMIIGKEDSALNYDTLIAQTKGTKVLVELFEDGHMSHIENQEALQANYAKFFKSCS